MSILSRWFRRIREKRRDRIRREYLEIEEENFSWSEVTLEDPLSIKNHVVSLCEQMIDISRELDDVRREYDQVTEYLKDIQMIESLVGEQKKQLEDVATQVSKLINVRNDYLNAEQKISDETFNQMECL
jgi:hypothetical protein